MQRRVPLWQWVIIVIGLLIVLGVAGRWVYNRIIVSKAPPPPASPEEAFKEYLGYPTQTPKQR
ncbi:MAG: hypothetical protein NZ805_09885 [Armatimonadetes bacterium]|nr:hypothetical protein [Armatimonadota bacterium]MDW8028946.1 hypothetical protein [Armatimonadota bacterium]